MTDKEIASNPANIRSLIRRISSNSCHPDPFKRLASVLCFDRVFSIIREFPPLVDLYCLEICYQVIGSLKLCYDKMDLSQEVIETSRHILKKAQSVILKHWGVLSQANRNRSIVPDIPTFMLFLCNKFKAPEPVLRSEALRLLEVLVQKGPL